MTNRVVVVPDVHQRVARLEAVWSRFPDDRLVYLGDWFDTHGRDGEADGDATWAALVEAQARSPADVFLWGNHDWWYGPRATPRLWISGSQPRLRDRVRARSEYDAVFARFRLVHRLASGLVASHAGVRSWPDLEAIERGARDEYWAERVGTARGGCEAYGGPLWLDWQHEFRHVPGLSQIVGHTQLDAPAVVRRGRHVDVDVDLDAGLRHVAIVELAVDRAPRVRVEEIDA